MQGVQLNAVDGVGNTPLMDAIRHSHKEVQAALRLAGANLSAVNVADKLCLAAAENDTATLEVCLSLPMPFNVTCMHSHKHALQRLYIVQLCLLHSCIIATEKRLRSGVMPTAAV